MKKQVFGSLRIQSCYVLLILLFSALLFSAGLSSQLLSHWTELLGIDLLIHSFIL